MLCTLNPEIVVEVQASDEEIHYLLKILRPLPQQLDIDAHCILFHTSTGNVRTYEAAALHRKGLNLLYNLADPNVRASVQKSEHAKNVIQWVQQSQSS